MFRMNLSLFWTCVLFLTDNANGYRILGLFLHSGTSHFDSFKPLMLELANRGHEVTVVSHFPLKEPMRNYNDISLKGTLPIWHSAFELESFKVPPFLDFLYHIGVINLLTGIGNEACVGFVDKEEIHQFKEGQFDIALVEMFNTDCALPLMHKLKLPYIGITSNVPMAWTISQIGLLNNPSIVHSHHMGHSNNPTMFQRLQTLMVNQFYNLAYMWKSQRFTYKIWSKYLDDIPPIYDLVQNTSMLFIYNHYTLHRNRLFPPSVLELGGYYLFERNSTLEPNTRRFLDDAEQGVVVFCMGSMINATSWPEDKLKAFQSAFSEIPQSVLWKWENETMKEKPANVKILKWIQQFDILKHKNVKGFITHGGNLGLNEALYAGKPVILIPMFGDQFNNAASAKDRGFGITLDYKNVTYESLKWGLKEILSPRMQGNAKRASEIFKDRPSNPTNTAIFWIEHVIKFGADHLRSPAVKIPLYKYLSLDILLSFIIGLIIIYVIRKQTKSSSQNLVQKGDKKKIK